MLLRWAFFSIVVLLFLCLQGMEAYAKGIVVLNSGQYNAYSQVEKGLKDAIAKDSIFNRRDVGPLRTYNLKQWKKDRVRLADSIRACAPDLIFTIGTPATRFAMVNIQDVPIVYSMVTSWWRFKGQNITGVHLKISEAQLSLLFSKILGLDSIALLCGKDWRLDRGVYSLGQRRGIHVYLFRIDAKHTIYNAFKIAKEKGIEGLLMVPDTDVYDSPETIRFVLEWTKKNGFYVMGLSPGYLKMGADVTIEIPFKALGAQTWAIGREILLGTAPGAIAPEPPKEIHLLINKKTVEKKELKVPDKVFGIPVFVR